MSVQHGFNGIDSWPATSNRSRNICCLNGCSNIISFYFFFFRTVIPGIPFMTNKKNIRMKLFLRVSLIAYTRPSTHQLATELDLFSLQKVGKVLVFLFVAKSFIAPHLGIHGSRIVLFELGRRATAVANRRGMLFPGADRIYPR